MNFLTKLYNALVLKDRNEEVETGINLCKFGMRLSQYVTKWPKVAEAATRGVLKKVFLEISQNSQENTCARVPFLIKTQSTSGGLLVSDEKMYFRYLYL